ncbi:MAG: hypothetical protein LBJ72_10375 [Dysgonamonadaceae bacterium]|jgi:hypothetical protein|nr:hypothetical protein [Dysgonamonadaceae bacterium]
MKRTIVIFVFSVLLIPHLKAQYWDWVTDEKSTEAFISNYGVQIVKLYEWLGWYKLIQIDQDTIAAKATFIHMVRDSLFKSLQDVEFIDNGKDEELIRTVFNEINMYYGKIREQTSAHADFKDSWTNYSKFVTDHSRDLLAMADMATAGKDEKNLLDKNQRLALLAYVLKELRGLRALSKETYEMLDVAIKGYEALNSNKK